MSGHQCLNPSYILEIQWNLDMNLSAPFFYAHFMCPTTTHVRTPLHFPGNTFVFSTQFINHTFKFSIKWCAAVIWNTINWDSGKKKMVFIYNFLTPLLSLCVHTISRQYHGAAHLDAAALAIPKNLACDPPDGRICFCTGVAYSTYLSIDVSSEMNQPY